SEALLRRFDHVLHICFFGDIADKCGYLPSMLLDLLSSARQPIFIPRAQDDVATVVSKFFCHGEPQSARAAGDQNTLPTDVVSTPVIHSLGYAPSGECCGYKRARSSQQASSGDSAQYHFVSGSHV